MHTALLGCSSIFVTLALQYQRTIGFIAPNGHTYINMGDRLKELEVSLSCRACVGKARNIFSFAALWRKHLPPWIRTSHLRLMSQAPVTPRPPPPRGVRRKYPSYDIKVKNGHERQIPQGIDRSQHCCLAGALGLQPRSGVGFGQLGETSAPSGTPATWSLSYVCFHGACHPARSGYLVIYL